MKKNISTLLILFAFCLLSFYCLYSYKNVYAEEDYDFKSKSIYSIDYDTKTVLFAKNENEKLPIASMCKIMTLNLIFDQIENNNLSLNEDIYVSENAGGMGGSQIFLDSNTYYKASELIKGIVVASANDACVAFAEKISGSESEFVEKMNQKARELKMDDTVFTNCTGLPKVGQYSTAKDVSIMFCELLSHKDYFNFSKIWLDKIVHKDERITEISNTNKLIRYYDGCDSGKTGFTNQAGFCLASSANRNNMRIVNVIINAPDSKTRFKETTLLFNNYFNNYEKKQIVNKDENLNELLKVNKGKEDCSIIAPEENFFYLSRKNEKQVFNVELLLDNKDAPIVAGDTVGVLKIYKDNILVKEINVLAKQSIDRKNYYDFIKDLTNKWTLVS